MLARTLVLPNKLSLHVCPTGSRSFIQSSRKLLSSVSPTWATTGLEFPYCRIVENRGVVRGVVVRSRNVIMDIGGQIQAFFGGNLSIYSEMADHARQDALEIMLKHASDVGGNAVIGMRYDTGTIMNATEVLCYGTAVRVEAIEAPQTSTRMR